MCAFATLLSVPGMSKAKSASRRKPNPADLTLRNLRALKKRIVELESRVKSLFNIVLSSGLSLK